MAAMVSRPKNWNMNSSLNLRATRKPATVLIKLPETEAIAARTKRCAAKLNMSSAFVN